MATRSRVEAATSGTTSALAEVESIERDRVAAKDTAGLWSALRLTESINNRTQYERER